MTDISHTDPRPHRRRRLFLSVSIAVLLCIGLLMLTILLVPQLLILTLKAQLQTNAARYDEVVRMVQAGIIPSGSINGDIVTLPAAYQNLSPARNGEVLIHRDAARLQVLFYPSNNFLLTQVYMYSSREVSSSDFHGECLGLESERPNWYLFQCP
jgi:hypothetical protein